MKTWHIYKIFRLFLDVIFRISGYGLVCEVYRWEERSSWAVLNRSVDTENLEPRVLEVSGETSGIAGLVPVSVHAENTQMRIAKYGGSDAGHLVCVLQ